ncbi:MAG: radical SAM protein [archaeon]
MKKTIRKSLLYKSEVEYADFCLNHVEGCSHGCNYPCYAFQMAKRFGKVKNYQQWVQPKLVSNALELLDKEIPKYKDQIKFVHLCFMTDPFMHNQKEVKDLTLKIIERLNKDKIRCTVLTKGTYPSSLTDLKKYGKNNEYGITLVSLDDDFKKKFEPNSAPFKNRIDSLKALSKKGVKTWVSIEPYPTPNIVKQDLNKLLNKVKFADKIVFGKLNYNVISSQFKGSTEFYDDCANTVKEFCKKEGIKYHIKYGTQKKDNKTTEKIFRSS